MNIETLKVPVSDLVLGMHVVKLDRPWLETPFKLQGFRITRASELGLLARYCRYVYIDVDRGVAPPLGKGERVVLTEDGDIVAQGGFIASPRSAAQQKSAKMLSRAVENVAMPPPVMDYPITSDFAVELPQARIAGERAKDAVGAFVRQVKDHVAGDLEGVRQAASALEDSILRNPDPLMLIRTLASDEPFSRRHCVHSAILAATLARELGLKRQAIHELTMGMLLADIGKMRLPKELLRAARRLTRQENDIIKLHVKYSVELAVAASGLTPGTVEIIASHHERFNGSGYPAGLRGGEIPLLARIAGLADSFDAITSERTYSTAIPAHEAVQELYAATVDIFQRELVEKLIQVLGPYPIGSPVALSDGSVAMVVALNRQRRLMPQVIPVADARRRRYPSYRVVDLAAASGLTVKEVLDPEACGVRLPTAAILPA